MCFVLDPVSIHFGTHKEVKSLYLLVHGETGFRHFYLWQHIKFTTCVFGQYLSILLDEPPTLHFGTPQLRIGWLWLVYKLPFSSPEIQQYTVNRYI